MNCCASIHQVILLLLLTIATVTELTAQQAEPLYYNYNTDAGLPSSECYEIIQDRQGYIWISSDNGVSRYDGREFENFGTEEGLTDKTILCMHEDHRGWIWMSSFAGNFFIYRADTIAAFKHNHLLQEIRDQYYLINDFIVDSSGSIDLGLLDCDLARITTDGQLIFHDFSYEKQGGLSYFIKDESLLSISRKRNAPPQLERKQRRERMLEQGLLSRSIIYDDSVYINLLPFNYNEYRFDGSNSRDYAVVFDTSLLIRFQHQLFWLPSFRQGHYQRGTTNGMELTMLIRDQENGGFYAGYFKGQGLRYFKNLDDLLADRPQYTVLQEHTITHLFQQADGELWVATLENGIYFLPSPLTRYIRNSTQYTFKIVANFKDDHILSASTQGLVLEISKNFQLRQHSNLQQLTSMESLYYGGEKTNLLVASNPLQIWQDNQWQLPFDDNPSRHHKSFIPTRKLIPSLNGKHLWSIDARTGVNLLDATLEGRTPVTTTQTILSEKKVTSLLELPNYLLLGTHDGLFRYDHNTTQAMLVGEDLVFQERVEDICQLSDTIVAVATRGSGLYLMSPNSLRIWTKEQGLASNAISFVRQDGDILWFGSKDGLHRVDIQQGLASLYIYTEKDGLAGSEVLDLVIKKEHAWVLTKAGLTKIDKEPPTRKRVPPLLISSFIINGEGVDLSKGEPLSLSWTENNIQLRFQFLSYTQLDDRQYRFRLNPDGEWIYRNTNQLDLLNLSPDTYQIEIQAQDKWRKWVQSDPVFFTIHPPFWRTSVFFLLCLLAGLALSWWFFRQRIQKISRERETLELQEEINQLKQQAYRAQMNPHFIFNCLGTIQGMVMGDSADKDTAVRLIASFSQLIRYALDASRQDFVSLKEEVSLLDRYLALERERFSHSFEFSIEVDPELETDWIQVPPMLVQPYVENAVLHGMEGKKEGGYIRIHYEQTDDHLQVTITDNGPGIFQMQTRQKAQYSKHKHRSVGMMITQKRLEMLSDGDLKPLIQERQSENGEISGTTIQLKIPL